MPFLEICYNVQQEFAVFVSMLRNATVAVDHSLRLNALHIHADVAELYSLSIRSVLSTSGSISASCKILVSEILCRSCVESFGLGKLWQKTGQNGHPLLVEFWMASFLVCFLLLLV